MNKSLKDSNCKDLLKVQLKNIIVWSYIEIFFQIWQVIAVILIALSFSTIINHNQNKTMLDFDISLSFLIIFICVLSGIFSYLNSIIIKLHIQKTQIKKLQFINQAVCIGNVFIVFGFIPVFLLIINTKELIKQTENS